MDFNASRPRAKRLVSVPTAVLVGGDGQVRDTVTGWDQPALAALIATGSAALSRAGASLTAPGPT